MDGGWPDEVPYLYQQPQQPCCGRSTLATPKKTQQIEVPDESLSAERKG
jgi:hypothetical protein